MVATVRHMRGSRWKDPYDWYSFSVVYLTAGSPSVLSSSQSSESVRVAPSSSDTCQDRRMYDREENGNIAVTARALAESVKCL